MALGLLFVVLCLGASFSYTNALNDTFDTDLDSTFGYELIMAALEDFQLRTQKDIQDSKNYTQEVNSNVENVQNSVSNNKQMLEDQKKNIDRLGKTISQLLDDKRIQQAIEQNSQMVISNIENVQKSVSNHERMLEDQKKNIDGLEHKFSQMLNDTRIQQVIEQNSQTVISNVEIVQKSLSNNERMLADQRKNIDGLEHKFSQLLNDTSKIIEAQRAQQIFNNIILASLAYGKRLLETCSDVRGRGSGIQMLKPRPEVHLGGFLAYCDQDYEGGGWTVIQNRFDGGVNFYRGWKDYEKGFGDLEGEHWLGLKNLHHLTNARPHELHVVLEDFEGKRVVAKYSHMVVGSAEEKYSLKKLGNYNGDAGNALLNSLEMKFSTFDMENDMHPTVNCAVKYSGAWWYNECMHCNLNGLYVKGETDLFAKIMSWFEFKGFSYGLKSSRMMIRATD